MEPQTEPNLSDFESSDITEISDIVSPRGERDDSSSSGSEESGSDDYSESDHDHSKSTTKEQTQTQTQPQSSQQNESTIIKLKGLLEALLAKEAEVKKKEEEHLAKAKAYLQDMNKNAAFPEFKKSKEYKDQLTKLKTAYDAANKQLSVLLKQQKRAIGTDSDDSSEVSSESEKEDKVNTDSSEDEELTKGTNKPSASTTLARVFIDPDEVKLLAVLAREAPKKGVTRTNLLMQQSHTQIPQLAPSVNNDDKKGVEFKELDKLFANRKPEEGGGEKFQPLGRSKSSARVSGKPAITGVGVRKKRAGEKEEEEPSGDEDDSDNDLENYIRKWRRARDEDILAVLKALRKENKLLKKKMKKERLRIGIELRRVTAANKVLEDQNRSMQELLMRAKIEIQSQRNPKESKMK